MSLARLLALCVIVLALAPACATSEPDSAGARLLDSPPAAASGATASAAAIAPPPPLQGPRKRVAVVRFESTGKFAQKYGDWDIGGGLAAQLTTALAESGYFVVVERAALSDVLREQEMALEKVVSKESAAKVGQVLGAQLLVKGAVTEFEQDAEGGGLKLGVGGLPGGVSLGGGGNTVSAAVTIDLRFIDTSTSQVVKSVRADGKASRRGMAASIDTKQISLGGDAFKNTALGVATRDAIMKAVWNVQQAMDRVPWTGRVMEFADGQVYINAGQDAAIKEGDTFVVSALVRELTDPETGAIRGIIENRIGQMKIEKVEDKFAIGRMVEGAAGAPKRGDFVKVAR
ncbi:MAG TPA: CsgG/HfaB family protein [Methylomirabilota bacterium]|jgi:curli biogenesis system outer membrane secretion channel CsgG|nr:CsgG/HfaB family protein [Methylomirabilota bacterium]